MTPAHDVPRSSAKSYINRTAKETDGLLPEPQVLYILNHGSVYGNLYAYDHLLSRDTNSPLHPRNVEFMARTGGGDNAEGIALGYPSPGSRRAQLVVALTVMARSLWAVRSVRVWREAWQLGRMTARARGQSVDLAAKAPSVRLAVFAYDLQVPIELTLALADRGVTTVALNERPQSLAISTQPFAVGTLLTASEHFSMLAHSNRSVSVSKSYPVGMWRTDFIHQYRSEPPHQFVRLAREAGQKLVVVLPYHLDFANPNPLGTSRRSVAHFIEGMLDLAEQYPALSLVLRSKNDAWLSDPKMQATVERLRAQPNCTVSREYKELNESYRLVAGADLVIAKYTSLVDECLAVGIPCLIHDYVPNARGITRPLVPYLPPELFVEHDDEWSERLSWALAEGGGTFRAWWEPHRKTVFGDWCDGMVRSRAQAAIERLYACGSAE